MVIEVDPVQRRHLVHTALAAVGGDAERVVDGFFALGIVEPAPTARPSTAWSCSSWR
jgi:predicted unusual protein kinase regulating ubiquinone biosynthesis (AarF/ABC1/UbiB family)